MELALKIEQYLEEHDALRSLNPLGAILYLSVLACAVTVFLH